MGATILTACGIDNLLRFEVGFGKRPIHFGVVLRDCFVEKFQGAGRVVQAPAAHDLPHHDQAKLRVPATVYPFLTMRWRADLDGVADRRRPNGVDYLPGQRECFFAN